MITRLANISTAEIAMLRRAVPRAFGRPLAERVCVALSWVAVAGVMAIAVSAAGTLAKLFAEAVENVDRQQIDGSALREPIARRSCASPSCHKSFPSC